MSMSAILLDTDYYDLLIEGRKLVEGYSVLADKYLIIFKAKAWIDLRHRKAKGEQVDSQNIRKHLNDIARLLGALSDIEKMTVPESIQNDLTVFLIELEENVELIPQNDAIIFTKQEILANLTMLLGVND